MRDKEYDEFGPWILQIKDAGDIPLLFRGYPLDVKHSLLTFKIPRKIERRQARPGMDLYDSLLELREDRLILLQRDDGSFAQRQVPYAQIRAIEHKIDLLDGLLTLVLDDDCVSIPYNTCSEELIRQVVGLIRARYPIRHSELPAASAIEIGESVAEYALRQYHKILIVELDGFVPFAAQNRHRVVPLGRNALKKLFRLIFPAEITGLLAYCGEGELVILSRGKSIVDRIESIFSITYTYIPYDNIIAVHQTDSQQYAALSQMEIQLGTKTFRYCMDADNPYKAVLLGLLNR